MENIFNIKIENFVPDIVDALSQVIGSKYYDEMRNKTNACIYLSYNDPKGIKDYYFYLLRHKRQELSLDLFKQMNIHLINNCFEVGTENEEINYLNFLYFGEMNPYEDYVRDFSGVASFSNDYINSSDYRIREEQVNFLNNYFFLGEKIIDIGNLDEFKETTYYKKNKDNLLLFGNTFINYRREYLRYKERYAFYLDYYDEKEFRRESLEFRHKRTLYPNLEYLFSSEARKLIESKQTNKYVVSHNIFDNLSDNEITYFKENYDVILANNADSVETRGIKYARLKYLKNLGYDIEENLDLLDKNIDEIYTKYMSDEKVRNLIPSQKLIEKFEEEKTRIESSIKLTMAYEDPSFKEKMAMINPDSKSKEALATAIVQNDVVVKGSNSGNQFIPLMYYTVRYEDGGRLEAILVHEVIHLCQIVMFDLLHGISGIDYAYFTANDKVKRNPYIPKKRLFERFNEALVDLLMLDTLDVLHKNNKYFMEPKELIRKPGNYNSSVALKNAVLPFYKTFFDVYIEAAMEGDLEILFDRVGYDNFIHLNDIINHIDYLALTKNLDKLIENNDYDNEVYKEYLALVEELIDLYDEMFNYTDAKKVSSVLR